MSQFMEDLRKAEELRKLFLVKDRGSATIGYLKCIIGIN